MRGGPKAIAYMLIISLLMGLLVVLIHPDYRDTARCMLRGRTEQSSIWIDNERYYPEVALNDTLDDDEGGAANGSN